MDSPPTEEDIRFRAHLLAEQDGARRSDEYYWWQARRDLGLPPVVHPVNPSMVNLGQMAAL